MSRKNHKIKVQNVNFAGSRKSLERFKDTSELKHFCPLRYYRYIFLIEASNT